MSRLIDADKLIGDLHNHAFLEGDDRAIAYNVIQKQPTVGGWISVKDRMPAETHSIFFRFYGTNNWNKAMWREQSDKVLVTVAFKDGTRFVTTGETRDGIWNTTICRTLEPVVTHWAEMPAPPEEDDDAAKR